jgi:hypothetical protein
VIEPGEVVLKINDIPVADDSAEDVELDVR